MFKVSFIVIITASLLGLMSAQSTVNITELCSLAPGSVVLAPNSCTDWIKCPSSPTATDMDQGSCVFGLYFNKNTGKCEYKDKVACHYEKITPHKNRCANEKDGEFLEDSTECKAYIYCKNGKEFRSFCPHDFVFNAITKSCAYKHEYKCPETKPNFESDLMCLSLKDGTFVADKNDCTKYNECRKGVMESHSCNSTSAWSYLERKCVPVDEVVCHPSAKQPEPELKVCVDRVGPVSDGLSCNGYYFCKKVANDTHDRKPEHYSCSAGSFFDISTLSCRDRVNVKCSLDRCDGMGNKYVNVAGDCRSYVLCKNGVANTKGYCPSGHYFDERTQGCTPQVVGYAACSA